MALFEVTPYDKKIYEEELTKEIIHSEEIILGLRLLKGISKNLFVNQNEKNSSFTF